jgi:hypothetical protein
VKFLREGLHLGEVVDTSALLRGVLRMGQALFVGILAGRMRQRPRPADFNEDVTRVDLEAFFAMTPQLLECILRSV